ncbi:M20/M25/M40 family metallo-hydrolase [Clostridium swellfunianum]|uniref:M28 family metallopeptidase n=1 Tax=Clostridium swellfunianum TaxID=1367462 RepID=UPI002030F182|nr:M20/M25/M40 family metallo-hydrolase [Clostridium swellfunianum]MCM0650068.1 M20/M25/M40 family metallo-hydrolase [Clostridium swellfunianum]
MSISSQREFELLKKIGFVRTSGSQEELKAANILLQEISSIGCEGHLEDFKVPTSNIKKVSLKVVEPYEKEYEVTPYNCSISTPEGGITTDFVYIEDGLDANLVDLKGKFVLINMGPNPKLYKKLMKAGIAGYITMSGTARDEEDKTDITIARMREKNTQYGKVTALNIRMKDGFHMVQNKASKVKVELITEDIELTSHNVVVTLEGTKYPDEIISFGAHYDSVPFSTGVYDNGAGSVIIMELLKHFKENPPMRTLKFVWYGSEEVGLLGSKAYLKAHEEELKKHLLMINVDVAGSILGREMALVTAEQSLIDYIDHMAKIKGYPLKVEQSIYSSDSTAFADAGIPSLTFCRFAPQGGAFIHTRHDVMDFLSAEALEKTTIITKDFSESVVNSVVFPIERKIPENMKKKLDEYFGKDTEKEDSSEKK